MYATKAYNHFDIGYNCFFGKLCRNIRCLQDSFTLSHIRSKGIGTAQQYIRHLFPYRQQLLLSNPAVRINIYGYSQLLPHPYRLYIFTPRYHSHENTTEGIIARQVISPHDRHSTYNKLNIDLHPACFEEVSDIEAKREYDSISYK